MTTNFNLILDRLGPGSTTAALSPGAYRGGSVKYATGVEGVEGVEGRRAGKTGENKKVAKVETAIGTWNVRTLKACGKAEVLVQEMDRLELEHFRHI